MYTLSTPPAPRDSPESRRWVMRTSMPVRAKVGLVQQLADVEHRLAFSTSEKLQLGSLVAAFVKAREVIAAAAQG